MHASIYYSHAYAYFQLSCSWENMYMPQKTSANDTNQTSTTSPTTPANKNTNEFELRFKSILETIKDGYFEVDLQGNFTFFNDALCRIVGRSREELMARYKFRLKSELSIALPAIMGEHSSGLPNCVAAFVPW